MLFILLLFIYLFYFITTYFAVAITAKQDKKYTFRVFVLSVSVQGAELGAVRL